jgi:hypothetical protein
MLLPLLKNQNKFLHENKNETNGIAENMGGDLSIDHSIPLFSW